MYKLLIADDEPLEGRQYAILSMTLILKSEKF